MDDRKKSDSPSCFVSKLDLKLAEKLKRDLEEQGFVLTHPQYTIFSAKKTGISCTLYTSGKLMVQGKEMGPFLEFYLEPEILGSFEFTHKNDLLDKTPRIGVDEAGKGDFFGPLCIAGVFAQGDEIIALSKMGVKDSKNLGDKTILKLAKAIKEQFQFHIIRLYPKRYNELYAQFKNLNTMLGWAHATVIESLIKKTGCNTAVIDQFAKESVVLGALLKKKLHVQLSQRHKAEEDLVVAAASILARAAFVEGIEEVGLPLNIILPKGASKATIETGKEIVRIHGAEALEHVAKTHFKTYMQVLGINPQE